MGEKLRAALLLGTVRPGRMCDRVASYVRSKLELSGFEVDIIDPGALHLQLVETPLHFYEDQSKAPQSLLDVNAKIVAADCYVLVSAEYNHCMPPALTNMLDHFPSSSFLHKPCALVCYSMGPFGGMRAAIQLRAMMAEMGTVTVPAIFAVAAVHETLSEDGQSSDAHLAEAANTTIEQLLWYTSATRRQREATRAAAPGPAATVKSAASPPPQQQQSSGSSAAGAAAAAKVAPPRGHDSGPCCQS